MLVDQLVESLLPTSEVCGSNPVIGKNLYWTFTVNCIEKTKVKKKETGIGQFLKKDNEQNESKLDQRKYLQAFGLDSSLKTGLWKDKRMGQEWFHIS